METGPVAKRLLYIPLVHELQLTMWFFCPLRFYFFVERLTNSEIKNKMPI